VESSNERGPAGLEWLAAQLARRIACPRRAMACVWLLGALVAAAASQPLLLATGSLAPAPFGLLVAPPLCLLVLAYVIWPLERAVARRQPA
jgi:hypothetical protein